MSSALISALTRAACRRDPFKIPGTAAEADHLAADYQRSGPDRE
jgi:hypothetical protein